MKEPYCEQLESGALKFVRDLPGPIERVWEYLVDPEKRAQWFCGGTMGEKPGDSFTLAFDHDTLSDEPFPERFAEMKGGIAMEGIVLEIEPPKLLVFRWPEEDRDVRIELAENGERVTLTLIQNPPADFSELAGAAAGWQAHLGILVDELEARPHRGFWSEHAEAERHYSETLKAA